MRKILFCSGTLLILLLFASWGDTGHSMIAFRINLFFNEEMSDFSDWIFYLSEHSSDADWRKKDDPQEGPRHYIDIDNYEGFVSDGRIPETLDSCIAIYGEGFVNENGTLPWATLAAYDSLVSALGRKDILNAKRFCADLSHYVADGHMPMHITRNYNGQFSGNSGIHARYEIEMVERYRNEINYEGITANSINNVRQYIFNYLYANYRLVDTILVADDYAREMSEGAHNDLYYFSLWEKTGHMTVNLFRNASLALTELLYSAWIEAGRPSLTNDPVTTTYRQGNTIRISLFPNPVRENVYLDINSGVQQPMSAMIYDSSGRMAFAGDFICCDSGNGVIQWFTGNQPSGIYYLVLESQYGMLTKPFILAR